MSEAAKQEQGVCALYASIGEYAEAIGVSHINELPGCWEAQVDDKMFVAVNGHQKTVKTSRGTELGPFNAFVEVNGWPAAVLNPFEGVVIGGSEDDLIARLQKAAEKASS